MGIYNIAVALLAGIAGLVIQAGYDWRVMLYAGVVPIVAALFARRIVPDDRRVAAWGTDPNAPKVAASKLPIAELFAPGVRRQTLLLACMTGLNFFAYQAFTGWASTYLKDVRGIDAALVGQVLFWQFLASAIGGFAWGWISDRIGRTRAALGFVLGAALIPVYLFAPLNSFWFMAVGFAYGFMLSSSTVWGPWLSELYPPHLRSTAASIFNWGRVISIFAPVITGALVPVWGMAPVMMLGCGAFLMAAVIWWSLPETLGSRTAKPVPAPAA
jgi:MFS family permease